MRDGGEYIKRRYRGLMGSRFSSFEVSFKETDLWVGVDPSARAKGMEDFAVSRVRRYRLGLEAYIASRPEFLSSLLPVADDPDAPPIAASMIAASAAAGVGPMAAVAGAFASFVGADLEAEFGCREVVVENGGDIWADVDDDLQLSVLAGSSPLSGRVGVSIPSRLSPIGVCTSSGTVGPSLSLGRADAAMVVACGMASAREMSASARARGGAHESAGDSEGRGSPSALADAWATSVGNAVMRVEDIDTALALAEGAAGIVSVLVIKGDRMGIRGELPLKLFVVPRSL